MTTRLRILLSLGLLSGACRSQCVLDDDVRLFAGDGARDCGSVGPADDRAPVDACVAEAFEGGDAFIARYEHMGVDSRLITAVASNSAGDVKIFQWDQSPCGGSGCDPVTDVQACRDPSLNPETSEDPNALPISCDDVGLPERTCG
jgi:hypothetical protein